MVALLPRRRQRVEARRGRFAEALVSWGLRVAERRATDDTERAAIQAALDDPDLFDLVLSRAELDRSLAGMLDEDAPPQRDWAGFFERFFAAFAEFLKLVLPLLLGAIGGLEATVFGTAATLGPGEIRGTLGTFGDVEAAAIGDRLRRAKQMTALLRQASASINLDSLRQLFLATLERVKSDSFADILAGARLMAKGAGWTDAVELLDLVIATLSGPRALSVLDLVTDDDVLDAVNVLRGQPGATASAVDWHAVALVAQLIFQLIRERMGQQ